MLASAYFSWTEFFWILSTFTGLLIALFVLHGSMVNLVILRYAEINNIRLYVATSEVIRNVVRMLVQAIFFGIGIWALSVPNIPHEVTTGEILISGAFILAACLLTVASLIDLIRFKEVLHMIEIVENGEQ